MHVLGRFGVARRTATEVRDELARLLESFIAASQVELKIAAKVLRHRVPARAHRRRQRHHHPLGRWYRVIGPLLPTWTAVCQVTYAANDANDLWNDS